MVLETNDFEKFFGLVYGESQGYVDLVTKSDEGVLDSERWFHWPTEKSMLAKYSGLRSDEDLYCSVGLYADQERSKDDHQAVSRVVYADLDTCHPDNLRIPPSIVVQTSDERWHGWWVLDEEVPLRDAAEASRRIYEAHKDQGVDRGWHVTKLLRVPGTTNTKYDDPFPVVAKYSDEVFTLDTINAVYADVKIETVEQIINQDLPKQITGKKFLALEERVEQAGLSDLYLKRPEEGQSWSERAYKLELELFRAGMTPQEVFSIMLEAACNKYNPDNAGEVTQTGVPIPKRRNPEEVLWREILKAYAEYKSTEDVVVETTPGSIFKAAPKAEFLSMEERKWCMDNPTFVDRYVEWVASRTDAAQTYSRSLGYVFLSCVFGGRGYLPLAFGRAELNLWVAVLGDTTRTRKTTAKNHMMKAVHRYEVLSGMEDLIDIGSDATGESLTRVLGERNGLVSLLHKDELNGWLSEMYGKNYRAGSLETFTELYDGQVPVVIRNSKDSGNRNRARTIFNFVGVGIRKRTAEILTRAHFESGFLARMLWTVADPPPRREGSEDISFAGEDEFNNHYDGVLEDMINDVIKRTRKWPLNKPSPIRMDEAARRRYNKWAEDAIRVAEKHGDGEILIPSFQRMKISVAKAAALLAMYDESNEITMRHLLPTLLQAEAWFNDMVRMASEVSSSDFERRLNEVEAFIRGGENQTRLESSIRRKFSRFRPRDMDEVFLALRSSGRAKSGNQRWQAL